MELGGSRWGPVGVDGSRSSGWEHGLVKLFANKRTNEDLIDTSSIRW